MAIFQPSNISPDSLSGLTNGVVDTADNVSISWQINGRSALTAYKIDVMQNNTDSTLVYSTGFITDNCPFDGTDEKGNTVYFTYAPTSTTWASWGLTNGNSYKLKITQYWGTSETPATDTDFLVVQYSASAFITRETPTLTLGTISSPLAKVSETFTATYSQAQGDSINFVRWRVWLCSDSVGTFLTELQDTGEINTSILSFNFDGFLAGNYYKLSCFVETESGQDVETTQIFLVNYNQTSAASDISVRLSNTDGSALLEIGEATNIMGEYTGSGTLSYLEGGGVSVSNGDITWDTANEEPMSFPSPYAIGLKGFIGGLSVSPTGAYLLPDGTDGSSETAFKAYLDPQGEGYVQVKNFLRKTSSTEYATLQGQTGYPVAVAFCGEGGQTRAVVIENGNGDLISFVIPSGALSGEISISQTLLSETNAINFNLTYSVETQKLYVSYYGYLDGSVSELVYSYDTTTGQLTQD